MVIYALQTAPIFFHLEGTMKNTFRHTEDFLFEIFYLRSLRNFSKKKIGKSSLLGLSLNNPCREKEDKVNFTSYRTG